MKNGIGADSTIGTRAVGARWATLAGFCASLVGIGLARFAYTPLLPAIIGAHWFDASVAAYLGAANLAGYLAGALLARPIAARLPIAVTLRGMMVLATIGFFACAYPISFSWFFAWRFLSGLAGGGLMVLAAPTVLPLVPAARRGLAGGVIFMGVGVGVVASGTLVPLLLRQSLQDTWLGLGVLALVATAIAWKGWPGATPAAAGVPGVSAAAPADTVPAAREAAHAAARHHRAPRIVSLRALYVEYALNAAGWVPHMIFLVDFVTRGLGQGLQAGAEYWVLFGIGATVGPVLAGAMADRTGFGRALRVAFTLQAAGVLIPALGLGDGWLMASSVVVGAFVTGTVPLVLGRVHELLAHHPTHRNPAWRTATVGFALFQAVAAYALSFVFNRSGGNYILLFVIGTVSMVLALAIDLVWGRRG
uniref:YbfB/YjiJ family MFS transporter n=1 Tax=Bordetella sputigena TaxID=1416810 RepID=UPI0039EE0706